MSETRDDSKFAEMSDRWIDALIAQKRQELRELLDERARRAYTQAVVGGSVQSFAGAAEYQAKAHEFAAYGDNAMYPALGLAEEAGEVCGKIAKYIRKHGGEVPTGEYEHLKGVALEDYIAFVAGLRKELGDVMWMVAELCTTYGLGLDDVMEGNIGKLVDRKERGVIVGEGDNR